MVLHSSLSLYCLRLNVPHTDADLQSTLLSAAKLIRANEVYVPSQCSEQLAKYIRTWIFLVGVGRIESSLECIAAQVFRCMVVKAGTSHSLQSFLFLFFDEDCRVVGPESVSRVAIKSLGPLILLVDQKTDRTDAPEQAPTQLGETT